MCECCSDFVRVVVANSALTAPATDPVTLTVDLPLTDLPANHCFTLCIPVAMLKNINTNTVELTDGTTTLPLITRCTDTMRYDSLVRYCNSRRTTCGYVKLRVNRRTAETPHAFVKTCMPRSTYVAPAAAADAAAAGDGGEHSGGVLAAPVSTTTAAKSAKSA